MNLHHDNETISKARAVRLCAYAKIVQDARKALAAICNMDEADCARYNARTRDVERNRGYPAGLERALNARHKTFCLITGCNG